MKDSYSSSPNEFELSKKLILVTVLPKGTCRRKFCEMQERINLASTVMHIRLWEKYITGFASQRDFLKTLNLVLKG